MKWVIPSCWLVLSALSVLILRSVAISLATQQLVYVLVGSGILAILSRSSFEWWQRWRWPAYAVMVILLIIPLLIGTTTRGIAAWIDIGTWFSIQPSQLAVLVTGLVVAHFLPQQRPATWKELATVAGIVAVPALLIALEPDLGTLIVFLMSIAGAVWVTPIPLKYVAGAGTAAVAVALFAWLFLLAPYQKQRITSFITPAETGKSDARYNADQALIAVGSGQVVGRGLGQGSQSHLRFLPERQTDFVFASLAEELGFLGSAMVVLLYMLLTLTLGWLSWRLSPHPASLFCVMTATMLLVQVGINIGMNMSLVPITGITLPFLSFGGSSFLSMTALLGICQSSFYLFKPKPTRHIA
jgi:rod shape determining protein RodA